MVKRLVTLDELEKRPFILKSTEDLADTDFPDRSKARHDLTWEQIIEIDPRIDTLYRLALSYWPDGEEPSAWYQQGFRWETLRLVSGQEAKPELRSNRVYDLVYDKIYQALFIRTGGKPRFEEVAE